MIQNYFRRFATAIILVAAQSSVCSAQEVGATVGTGEGTGINLLAGADGEESNVGKYWIGVVRRNTTDAKSGGACLEIPQIGTASLRRRIKIDHSKQYEIGGYFKSANPKQLSRVLMDVRYLTADGQPINPRGVTPASSLSVVLEDAKIGATKLKVAKKDWPEKVSAKLCLALGAREDLSDLPNFNLAGISNFVVGKESYEITLSKPLTSDVSTGTGVRLNRYTDHPRVWNSELPEEWTELKFQIGEGTKRQYWPGAEYAEILIIHQYNQHPQPLPAGETPPHLLMDDLFIFEINP